MKRAILKTEPEYDAALKRTIRIFHAEKNSLEFAELQMLLPLIMAYEEIHYPIPKPDRFDK
jgi:HTH-type transcriptional regulator/antitoxin HigA